MYQVGLVLGNGRREVEVTKHLDRLEHRGLQLHVSFEVTPSSSR